jgi:hypothetical protein
MVKKKTETPLKINADFEKALKVLVQEKPKVEKATQSKKKDNK